MLFSLSLRGALALAVAVVLAPAFPPSVQAAASKPTPAKTAPAKNAAVKETPQQIEVKLIAFASEHLRRANTSLRPNKSNPETISRGGQFVARYIEVDAATFETEMTPSEQPGCLYVGHVVYIEKEYECLASTKAAASKGPYNHVKTRRIRELTRYDKGTWHY